MGITIQRVRGFSSPSSWIQTSAYPHFVHGKIPHHPRRGLQLARVPLIQYNTTRSLFCRTSQAASPPESRMDDANKRCLLVSHSTCWWISTPPEVHTPETCGGLEYCGIPTNSAIKRIRSILGVPRVPIMGEIKNESLGNYATGAFQPPSHP